MSAPEQRGSLVVEAKARVARWRLQYGVLDDPLSVLTLGPGFAIVSTVLTAPRHPPCWLQDVKWARGFDWGAVVHQPVPVPLHALTHHSGVCRLCGALLDAPRAAPTREGG